MKNRQEIYKITCIVLMLDQIMKIIVNHTMKLHQEIKIIPNFFSLYHVRNTGAAFSILENNTTFLIILTVILIIVIDRLIRKENNFSKLSILSLGLVLGGMFGNLIDRIIHKGVIDYLSFTIFKYDFPVFNLADIGITVGVFLLLISTLKEKEDNKI
ncbi:MAG: signal peptidase II [Bacilli bacterium]|nr:signal peptidase II [Bacilli bacterium]